MYWIIGDIHGMARPLESILAEIDRRDAKRELIFAGDYVNRGPDSRQVIDLLRKLSKSRFVRGNHDDVFDLVLHGKSFSSTQGGAYERIAQFRWFMNFGLFQTFRSYGADEDELIRADELANIDLIDELCAYVPAEHKDFVQGLVPVIEEDEFFVLHAKWGVDRPTESPHISEQVVNSPRLRESMIWGRFSEEELTAEKVWQRRGYFGHTPVTYYTETTRPILAEGMVLVDTGAALPEGQRLTAYCHETNEFVQADPSGRLIKSL